MPGDKGEVMLSPTYKFAIVAVILLSPIMILAIRTSAKDFPDAPSIGPMIGIAIGLAILAGGGALISSAVM